MTQKQQLQIASPGAATGWLLFLVFSAALGSYLCDPIFRPDVFFHLTVGDWIMSHKALPEQASWALAGANQTWRSGSWLFDFKVAVIHQAFDMTGLVLFKVMLFVALSGVLVRVYGRVADNFFVGGFIATLVATGTLLASALNAQLAGYFFFVLILAAFKRLPLALHRARAAGGLFFLLVIASNVHPSGFVASAVGLLLFAGILQAARLLIPVAVMTIVAPLFTPYFGMQLLTAVQSFFGSLQVDLFMKLQPLTVFDYSFVFLLCILMLIVALLIDSRRALRFGETLVLAGATVLGFASKQYVPFALIVGGFIVVLLWKESATGSCGAIAEGIERLEGKFRSLYAVSSLGVIWVLLCVTIVNIYPFFFAPMLHSAFPEAELDYVLQEETSAQMLHSPDIGNYVAYRFASANPATSMKAAVDTTSFATMPMAVQAVLRTFQLFPGVEYMTLKSGVRYVLCRASESMFTALSTNPEWELRVAGGMKLRDEKKFIPSSDFQWVLFERRVRVES